MVEHFPLDYFSRRLTTGDRGHEFAYEEAVAHACGGGWIDYSLHVVIVSKQVVVQLAEVHRLVTLPQLKLDPAIEAVIRPHSMVW